MITKSPGFQTDDGTWHSTITKAKYHELRILFGDITGCEDFMKLLLEKSEQVISILRATGRKARKAKPGRPKGSRNKSVAVNGNEEAKT